MDPQLVQLGISVVTGLVVAIVTAIVTVQLSLRRFYSEKWWERKSDAYANIMEALYEMKKHCDDTMQAEEPGREISEAKKEGMRKTVDKASDEITKQTYIGSFIISNEAVQELRKMDEAMEEAGQSGQSYLDYLLDSSAAVNNCMDKIRLIAKRDLKVD